VTPYYKPKGQLGDSRDVPEGKATSWQIKEERRTKPCLHEKRGGEWLYGICGDRNLL
jgi:hypothetical protein